jgi:hypothetical protein
MGYVGMIVIVAANLVAAPPIAAGVVVTPWPPYAFAIPSKLVRCRRRLPWTPPIRQRRSARRANRSHARLMSH